MGSHVQVSARVLNIPPQCCCCGSPHVVGKVTARYTRVTGKRVIHSQERSWSFPICHRCRVHAERFEEAIEADEAASSMKGNAVMGIVFGALLSPLLVGLPILALGIYALVYWVPAAREKAHLLVQKATHLLTGSCSCKVRPVKYRGWEGSVHHFEFASQTYANAFTEANRKKIIG